MHTASGRTQASESGSRLVFVPGANCRAFEDYPKTCAALTDAGFAITAISPVWDAPFEQLVEQVKQEVHDSIGENTLVLAHSRGANLVMPALVHRPNIGVIIASPSMACAEGYADDGARPLAEKRFPNEGHIVRRVSMLALASASTIVSEHAAVLVGEQEVEEFPFMSGIAHKTATGFDVPVTHVAEAPHFIDYHDNYVRAVADAAVRIRSSME